MGTVIQDTPPRNDDRQPRWDRCERAPLFAHSRARRAQGLSQRPAAQALQVPRRTLQAWRTWPDPLALCPDVARCLHRGPGRALVHRLVLAFPLVCVAVGACGLRLACLCLTRSALDRLVAAASGAQPQVNRPVDAARVASRQSATARVAQAMPRTDRTVTQDDTWTGGRCLVTMDPDSHGMLVAQRPQARDHTSWEALMAPALAPRKGQGIPSTSEAAPGLLAYVAHALEAPPAPDLCHGQPARRKAVSAPLAITEPAAPKAAAEAHAQRAQGPTPRHTTGGAPDKRGPGRPPKALVSLEHAEQALSAARRQPARLAQQRAQVAQSRRAIGHADHGVDRERGGRRHGPRLAAESQGPIAQARARAQHAGRSQRGVERIAQAARVVPHRPATRACVSRYVGQQGNQREWTPPASFAMPAKLLPSCSLARVAQTRTVRAGEPLRERAARRRAPWCEPGGALRALSPEAHDQLHDEAKRRAAVFQRSRAHGEGRNGSLSLRHHPLRGLDLPRTRECCTARHHFFLTRPDGTTAAERCFGQKPRSMFAAIVDSVDLPPAPLSPPRRP